ncbi:uncharacterized protein [Physcomitrium patens]|uniref:Ycf49-like protein n=1 Tax=Physcomitrium patens TaxID=3218 RepID=A0A7I3ZXV0_PHYPA|nr:uncharacterized protein LOC112287410 isoform X1 [Physcomitrium patens]|eukprot:XP_024386121.1 uncharacterized protein LOC112287410 isoform X1 [Physcomitrella patens]
MATMPSLLSKNACILGREHSAAKNAGSRIASPQFSLRSNVPLALSNDTPLLESTPTSCTLDMISTSLMPLGRPLGLDRPARCVLGVGAVAGAMMVFPEHAHAAEIVSNSDAWSLLVASEPKNALSLPTWVIHVASVAECSLPVPCRMLGSVFDSGEVQSSFRETELTNALSLPTWFIHVASVVEWITAMALVWQYGDTPGNSSWKGLSWGMVPLLGGAMCACTWHFFYNAPALEILVVLQAALTVIGNFTMWAAAFRIYQSSQTKSKEP